MNLIRTIAYFEDIPKGYGVFYIYVNAAKYKVAPIPLNLLLGFIYAAYYWARAGIHPKWYYAQIEQARTDERARSLEQLRNNIKREYRKELWEELTGYLKDNLNVVRIALDTKINTEEEIKEKFEINEEGGD